MEKNKDRSLGIFFQPLNGRLNNISTLPFDVSRVRPSTLVKIKCSVIKIEALVETKAAIQDKASYECCCMVPMRLQHAGQCKGVRWNLLTVVFDARSEE